jgi:Rrf2 family protein
MQGWPALPKSIATALKALIYLRGNTDRLVPILEIAEETGISRPYLGKILHTLSQEGLVRTRRGNKGGVTLAKDASTISVFDVIMAVEGENWKVGCLLYPNTPKDKLDCPVHGFWSDMRGFIEEKLRNMPLEGLPFPLDATGPTNETKDWTGFEPLL